MSGQPIDIRPDHEVMVRDILVARLPEGVRVWAFGSRAKWLAKPYSDLDLALEAADCLPDALIPDLKDDFRESDLPWKVDVLDLNAIAPSFRKLIDKDRVVFSLREKWRRCTLGGLVDFNPRTPVAKGESAPFVDMATLPTGDKFFPIADVREFKGSGSKFKDDDTLLARITPCLENGKGGFVQGLGESISAHGSTEFIVLRAKTPSDKDFAYYITKHPDFRAFAIKQMSGTSGRQRVSWQSLTYYELHDLLPEEREEIGNLLGSLDDKIDLNRRMNATLEAMARAIFKDWFVDFGPTRAKMEGREPYLAPEIWELFPEKLGGDGLPVGWDISNLGEHSLNYDRKRVPLSKKERASRQGKFPYHGATGVMDYVDDFLFDGVFVLVGEDGSVAKEKTGLAFTQYAWRQFWVNNHAHVLQGKGSVSTEQILMYFQHEPVTPYITGAVQLKLSQGRMNSMPFIFPDDKLCMKFGQTVLPLFTRIRANDDETRTLAQTRDLLLPKLMSGEIRVREAEGCVEAAG